MVSKCIVPCLVLGAFLSAAGFVWSFTVSPLVFGAEVLPELIAGEMVGNQLLFSQKVFYFHMPISHNKRAGIERFKISFSAPLRIGYPICERHRFL